MVEIYESFYKAQSSLTDDDYKQGRLKKALGTNKIVSMHSSLMWNIKGRYHFVHIVSI